MITAYIKVAIIKNQNFFKKWRQIALRIDMGIITLHSGILIIPLSDMHTEKQSFLYFIYL